MKWGFIRAVAFALASVCLVMGINVCASAQRLGDIATFDGVRSNPLVGYGLVVGLNNTGDQTTQTPFTGQSIRNMLTQLGVTVAGGTNMQLKNVAAVMVTADLPAFAATGQNIDVTVSSIGTADSLTGGTLLMTPLKGADGNIYALAQGSVLAPGLSVQAAGSSVQVNQTAAGRIPEGAVVERKVESKLADKGTLDLELKHADFATATRAMNAVNDRFGQRIATAHNSRLISIAVPSGIDSTVAFIAAIQDIRVQQGTPRPRVIVNSRTGSVVMNGRVTLDEAAVAHGSLSVTIDSNPIVSQPNALSGGQTAVVPNADINVQQDDGSLNYVPQSTSLRQVIDALNRLGATPVDLMAILEALKAAGALNADLEVI
ncbi:flagellar basal body P-ring protein FlgI [Salinisphaera sp. Q1T1-3]|uniref:flagellar basal body P-ring protein FlgI n=1 Tax=Salinisphaera sp. Q1T1-3 TaxID=2321229 RepID=UPI000E708A23|nr:flagellar basal body P-ring protein FlgI [Salinisphaera sp. Q1T1-3]RJS95168.1 flagellar basal body P-ring protein FlgI [Salinisphaera sp. Q1T1-3]